MRLAAACLLAAGALAAAVLFAGRDAPARPAPAPTVLGDDHVLLESSVPDADAALASMRRVGADWVSIPADWARLAPSARAEIPPARDSADPAAYGGPRWARLDHLMRAARRRGLGVMVELRADPPAWAGARPANGFARFATAVARRYSGRFRGLPAAAAFTIGDEPNRGAVEAGGRPPSPAALVERYRELVRAAGPAVAAAAPEAVILLGGTAPGHGPGTGAVDPVGFLRALACLSAEGRPRRDGPCAGFRPLSADGWAHHPADLGGPGARGRAARLELARLAAQSARLHAAGRLRRPLPVVVTRHEQSGGEDGAMLYEQARRVAEAEWAARHIPGVRGFAHSPLRDRPPRGAGLQQSAGLPKPALGALAFPFVVHRTTDGRLVMWGRVRPREARGRFRVSLRQLEGGWRALPQFRRPRRTDPGGYFSLEARTGPGGTPIDPGGTYRLELLDRDRGWRAAGLPIFGASPAPSLTPPGGSSPR